MHALEEAALLTTMEHEEAQRALRARAEALAREHAQGAAAARQAEEARAAAVAEAAEGRAELEAARAELVEVARSRPISSDPPQVWRRWGVAAARRPDLRADLR